MDDPEEVEDVYVPEVLKKSHLSSGQVPDVLWEVVKVLRVNPKLPEKILGVLKEVPGVRYLISF